MFIKLSKTKVGVWEATNNIEGSWHEDAVFGHGKTMRDALIDFAMRFDPPPKLQPSPLSNEEREAARDMDDL